jgi:hypothetical protein
MNYVNKRHDSETQLIEDIAGSGADGPVMMINLNYYSVEASFPSGELYKRYMSVLEKFLPVVGAKILWRHPVFGQVTGEQPLHEILAAWYPTHQAFLDLLNAPGSEENFRLRALAVEAAVIHRVTGDEYPFSPV